MPLEIFDAMIGKTMDSVVVNENQDQMVFKCGERTFTFLHYQDCCESVSIEDICGDLTDLVGSPIIMAEEVSSESVEKKDDYDDSGTWTFYKFATNKGTVTVRWLGTSNGCYSESVTFVET
jgi:hypothetical protein